MRTFGKVSRRASTSSGITCPERSVKKNAGLVLIDVEGDAAETVLLEDLDQRPAVHKSTATRIDEDGVRPKERELLAVEQMPRPRREWGVQRDDVAPLQELVEGHDRERGRLGRVMRVTCDHLAAESSGDVGDDSADPAETNDPERPTGEDRPDQPVDVEVAVPETRSWARGMRRRIASASANTCSATACGE